MIKRVHRFFHGHYHRHYHGVYRNPKKLFIFDLFLLGLALTLFTSSLIFFFWKPGIADKIDVAISIGNSRLKSGEPVKVSISYTNRSELHLQKPRIALRLPSGFIVDRSKTTETIFNQNSTFVINDIEPGAKGQVELYGWLWVEPKKHENIIATLSYIPEEASRREQKFSSYFANLPESILKETLVIPENSFPGQKIPVTYTLTNQGNYAVENIHITPHWTAPIFNEKKLKNITLSPGETATLTGELTAPGESRDYILSIAGAVLANNQLIPQGGTEKKFTILKPALGIEIKSLTNNAYIEPGQTIPLQISWKNNSPFPLSNLRIRLENTPTGLVNLAATAKAEKMKVDGQSLLIGKETRTALANGEKGAADTFKVELQLAKSFNAASGVTPSLEITPVIEAETATVSGQTFRERGTPLRLPLATSLNLQTAIRYFTAEDDQLGRGPLPPRVGETTKYWIFAEIFNTINPVTEPRFGLKLAPGVTFTGKQSVTIGQPLVYNSGTVSWQHDRLPANSKTGLYFEVAVQPLAAERGKILTLVSDSSFTATDEIVGKKFELNGPRLTNILKADDRGSLLGATVR